MEEQQEAALQTANVAATQYEVSSIIHNQVLKEFLGGTAGGLAGVLSGHPADTIRVRLQTDVGVGKYSGFFDCARKTLSHETFRGLYKGLVPPLVGETLNNCVLFGVFGVLKPWQEQYNIRVVGEEDYSLAKDLGVIAASGAIAGACISLIVCPTELVKIQFQNNTSIHKETITQCIQRLQRERRSFIAGAFHGYCATMWRELAFGASYFLAYESTKRVFAKILHGNSHKTHDLGMISLLASGGMAGAIAWGFAYPTDYVKSRVQADSNLNTRKVLRSILFEERSLRSAYRGFGPTVLRAFPVNAITFLSYEMIVNYL